MLLNFSIELLVLKLVAEKAIQGLLSLSVYIMGDMYIWSGFVNQIIEFYPHGGGRFMILRAKRAII